MSERSKSLKTGGKDHLQDSSLKPHFSFFQGVLSVHTQSCGFHIPCPIPLSVVPAWGALEVSICFFQTYPKQATVHIKTRIKEAAKPLPLW